MPKQSLLDRLEPSQGLKAPRPRFFDLSEPNAESKLTALLAANSDLQIIDTYETQLEELFVLQKPWLNFNPDQKAVEFAHFRAQHYGGGDPKQAGLWVHLPWRNALLHILKDEDYQRVRTGRNQNLITADEQTQFYNATIGIAGLSVGNSVALGIVLTGGGKHMRLADPDTLELTNLNRIRGSVAELTEPKVNMTARQVYELDPFAQLELHPEGLTEENIERFFDGPPKLDVVIDEIDNIGMKIRIRQEAKKRGIPVVMAADNGDGGVLDVERHDLEGDVEFFHGRAGSDIVDRVLGQNLPLPEIGRIITEELLGADTVMPRMQDSLLAIGQSIPTWPQLGGAALLNGAAVAATVRRIILGLPVVDDRAVLALESWLEPGFNTEGAKEERGRQTQEFLKQYHARLEQAKQPEAIDPQ